MKTRETLHRIFYDSVNDGLVTSGKDIKNAGTVVDVAVREILRSYRFFPTKDNSPNFEELHEQLEDYIKTITVVDFGTIAERYWLIQFVIEYFLRQ